MASTPHGGAGAVRSVTCPSAPRVSNAHLFRAGARHMLLSVPRGQVYEIDDSLADAVDRAMSAGDGERVGLFLAAAGIAPSAVPEEAPASVPVRALSLAIAQKCNLGCNYCYARQGDFGGVETHMSLDVAKRAIDRLLEEALPGERVSVAYLGGEPLAGRKVLRAATEYGVERAALAGVEMAFSITTNATLLAEEDAELFERYAFAVTISVDGVGAVHDRLRPFKSGQGSYDRVVERSRLLLSRSPRRCQATARVTVTPQNLRLRETLDELVRLGFDGVQFSPVLSSPTGDAQMGEPELAAMLDGLIECGREFERRLRAGEPYPFLNVVSTLRQIHKGGRTAYPCGAGGGYLGVSAGGGLYACHRFVDDDLGAMGNVDAGVDAAKRRRWLSVRNVHVQDPCRTCWARYLCGGGCHHEALHRGRPACDYIRGWLHYCLGLYGSLRTEPALLGRALGLGPKA